MNEQNPTSGAINAEELMNRVSELEAENEKLKAELEESRKQSLDSSTYYLNEISRYRKVLGIVKDAVSLVG